ncbi:MAG TPA: protein-tyrosine-phosphatase [Pirellula sp.]|nr:protein-tyrosine-phosphatase [Pirellula sp.]
MTTASAEDSLFPRIESFVKERLAETAEIPEERQKELLKLSRYIATCQSAGKATKLLFVCTHNSRRSQLAQLWAKIGAMRFGLQEMESFSGGTEATAMNHRTVAALERVGMEIAKADGDSINPKYTVAFSKAASPQICFSKKLTELPNPTKDFAAIMTCSSADESCPIVRGCELRLALPYEDPKTSDDTPNEAADYDEKCKEISREMLFLMSRVAESK